MTWLSVVLLTLGMLAYGFAGAELHTGSQSSKGALKSKNWWLGTGLQGVAFLLMALARRSLPLLIVQACSAGGLAVTAVIQHLNGRRRLRAIDAGAVGAVVVGLGLLAVGTQPGESAPITTALMWLLGLSVLVGAVCLRMRMHPGWSGLVAGLGFAAGAVGARLVIGDVTNPFWLFWRLPWENWVVGLLTAAAIVLGQVHLTVGLKNSTAAPVLAVAFMIETLYPAAVGLLLMGETPRPGTTAIVIIGLLLLAWGIRQLLVGEQQADVATQSSASSG